MQDSADSERGTNFATTAIIGCIILGVVGWFLLLPALSPGRICTRISSDRNNARQLVTTLASLRADFPKCLEILRAKP